MRLITYILLVQLFSASLFGQNWQWAKHAAGAGDDQGISICSDQLNNTIVTGVYTSTVLTFGNINLVSNGGYDVYIAKYDENGTLLWARTANDSSDSFSHGIASDLNGNTFVVGEFNSQQMVFGSHTITSVGGLNGFIAKYDSSGNVIWAKVIGNGGESINSVAVDKSGNVYILGNMFADTVNIGNHVITSADFGYADIFIAKFDTNGNTLWAQTAHSSQIDGGSAIATDKMGNVYFTGTYWNNDFTVGNISLGTYNEFYNRYFIAKLDTDGNGMWIRGSSINDNQGTAICTDSSGNVIATGSFASPFMFFDSFTINNYATNYSGKLNSFIVKYDPNGNTVFANSVKGYLNWGMSIASDRDDFYVTGFTGYPIILNDKNLPLPDGGGDAMYLFKYNAFGDLIYPTIINGGGYGQSDICVNRDGDIYITAGFFSNPLILGTHTISPNVGSSRNLFTAKMDCYGINTSVIEYSETNDLKLFPNPNKGIFILKIQNIREVVSFSITNLMGQIVYTSKFDGFESSINVSMLQNGIYNCTLIDKNGKTLSQKLIIE